MKALLIAAAVAACAAGCEVTHVVRLQDETVAVGKSRCSDGNARFTTVTSRKSRNAAPETRNRTLR